MLCKCKGSNYTRDPSVRARPDCTRLARLPRHIESGTPQTCQSIARSAHARGPAPAPALPTSIDSVCITHLPTPQSCPRHMVGCPPTAMATPRAPEAARPAGLFHSPAHVVLSWRRVREKRDSLYVRAGGVAVWRVRSCRTRRRRVVDFRKQDATTTATAASFVSFATVRRWRLLLLLAITTS